MKISENISLHKSKDINRLTIDRFWEGREDSYKRTLTLRTLGNMVFFGRAVFRIKRQIEIILYESN